MRTQQQDFFGIDEYYRCFNEKQSNKPSEKKGKKKADKSKRPDQEPTLFD